MRAVKRFLAWAEGKGGGTDYPLDGEHAAESLDGTVLDGLSWCFLEGVLAGIR